MASTASDPLPGFSTDGRAEYLTANCYAYALNIAEGTLNPGMIGGGTMEAGTIAAMNMPLKAYRDAATADGLLWMGDDEDAVPAAVTGTTHTGYLIQEADYLVVFGMSRLDMHWQRIDSLGRWSEKIPNEFAVLCEGNRNITTSTSDQIAFRGWFLVRDAMVRTNALKLRKKGARVSGAGKRFCVIL